MHAAEIYYMLKLFLYGINMATGVEFQVFPQSESAVDETPRLDTLAPVQAATATAGGAPPTAPTLNLERCMKIEKK